MASPARTKLLTAEEFYRLPEPEHGGKMELVRGKVIVYMPVSSTHGATASRIDHRLRDFVEQHDLGETYVEVGHRVEREPDTVRAPDVQFIAKERLADVPPQGWVERAPTLAIEVKSPGETEPSLVRKAAEHLDAGALRVWIVRPEQRNATVYRNDGVVTMVEGEAKLTSEDAAFDVDGFELPLAYIFR